MTIKDQRQANRLKRSFSDLYSGGGSFEFQPDHRLLLTHVFRDFPHSVHVNAITYWKVWRDHFVPLFSQLILSSISLLLLLLLVVVLLLLLILLLQLSFHSVTVALTLV